MSWVLIKCDKSRGSRAIMGLVDLAPWWVFRGSEISSRGHFVGTKFFLVAISWVRNFFSQVIGGYKLFYQEHFLANFIIQRFSFFGCMRQNGRRQKYIKNLKSRIRFQIDVSNFQYQKDISSTKQERQRLQVSASKYWVINQATLKCQIDFWTKLAKKV